MCVDSINLLVSLSTTMTNTPVFLFKEVVVKKKFSTLVPSTMRIEQILGSMMWGIWEEPKSPHAGDGVPDKSCLQNCSRATSDQVARRSLSSEGDTWKLMESDAPTVATHYGQLLLRNPSGHG